MIFLKKSLAYLKKFFIVLNFNLNRGQLAQLVRASVLHTGGHRFESCTAHHFKINKGFKQIAWSLFVLEIWQKTKTLDISKKQLIISYTMNKKEKLLKRLLSVPKDFTWSELVAVLEMFGYQERTGGKSGGSRRKFFNQPFEPIYLHKPHPKEILKEYQIKIVIDKLKERNLV